MKRGRDLQRICGCLGSMRQLAGAGVVALAVGCCDTLVVRHLLGRVPDWDWGSVSPRRLRPLPAPWLPRVPTESEVLCCRHRFGRGLWELDLQDIASMLIVCTARCITQ